MNLTKLGNFKVPQNLFILSPSFLFVSPTHSSAFSFSGLLSLGLKCFGSDTAIYPGLGYRDPTSSSGLIFIIQSTQIGDRGYNEAKREFGSGSFDAMLRLSSGEVEFPSE